MNRYFALLTYFLLGVQVGSADSERLLNGDFEQGVPTKDKAASFEATGWRRQLWKPHELNTWLTDGSLDWQVGKGNQAAEFRWGASSITQLFSAAAGEVYVFSAEALNPADQESRWEPQIQVEWFDATDTSLGGVTTVVQAENATAPRQEWYRISGESTAPSGTAYGRIFLNVANSGRGNMWIKTYMDNASVLGNPGTHNLPVSFISSPYTLALQEIPESKLYEDDLTRVADDNDGDSLRFEKLEGPAWLTLQPDGTLTGTPAFEDAGDNVFRFRVSDGKGSTDVQTVILPVRGHLRLANLFDADMVLQRGRPLEIRGQAVPNSPVNLRMSTGESAETTADGEGAWSATLPAMSATREGTVSLSVISGPRTLSLDNLLVGDVWFCSGQSNMAWALNQSENAEEVIASATLPRLRFVTTPKEGSNTRLEELPARADWQVCSPESVPRFSAVATHFGRRLLQETGVPIGLISSNVGGTRIESWTGQNLYNSMVHPYTRLPITGVIWYQGEANLGDGLAYTDKMVNLVSLWREVWQADLPFYYVQLAPFAYPKADPRQLPLVWEAQTRAMAQIPNSGMVVINDIGNPEDIHPRIKRPVGERLARWALHHDYGKQGVLYSGPVALEAVRKEGIVRIRFEHAEGGLTSRDGSPLSEFELAGGDGTYVPAEAMIQEGMVLVRAEGITEPRSVRFAWRNIAEPNLVNQAGLPASAFALEIK